MKTCEIIEQDWQLAQVVDKDTLRRWETTTGYRLPEDYRAFLLKYNGGVIKPWMFRHNHPLVDASYRKAILDFLHEWEAVVHNSHLDTPLVLATRPPGHIEIGKNPGGGRILLSLQPGTHGNVFYWLPSYMAWGEEPNDVVGFIAPSFTEFLACLFDDGETEHGDWDVLASERPPVPLVL